jgi:hypothetical protein
VRVNQRAAAFKKLLIKRNPRKNKKLAYTCYWAASDFTVVMVSFKMFRKICNTLVELYLWKFETRMVFFDRKMRWKPKFFPGRIILTVINILWSFLSNTMGPGLIFRSGRCPIRVPVVLICTVRWSTFDRRDPKIGGFLQSTEATPCGHVMKAYPRKPLCGHHVHDRHGHGFPVKNRWRFSKFSK